MTDEVIEMLLEARIERSPGTRWVHSRLPRATSHSRPPAFRVNDEGRLSTACGRWGVVRAYAVLAEYVPDAEDRGTFLALCDEADLRGVKVVYMDPAGIEPRDAGNMQSVGLAGLSREWRNERQRPYAIAALARALRDNAPVGT